MKEECIVDSKAEWSA